MKTATQISSSSKNIDKAGSNSKVNQKLFNVIEAFLNYF